MGHARRGIHPRPTFGLHFGGDARQLVLRQPFQQRGIGQIHAFVAFGEQVAADAAAFALVGVQPDEAHQRMPVGVDFAFGETVAQVVRAALPCRRIVERAFLRGVVVGNGKGHQLVKAHGLGAVVGQQARRDVGEFQAALHHQRRDGKIRCNVLDAAAFGHQRGECLELVGGVHGFALHVLGEAGRAGGAIGHQQARHVPFLADAALLRQQLQGGKATASGHDFVTLAVSGRGDDQVLQQAHTLDGCGQFGNGHARGLAHVAPVGRDTSRDSETRIRFLVGSAASSVGAWMARASVCWVWVLAFMVTTPIGSGMQQRRAGLLPACRVGNQAFNWRRPSASIQRARLRRTSESMPCTGRVCWRRPLALRPANRLWSGFLGCG